MFKLYHKKYCINDYFSWEFYDWLPKSSGDTDLLFIGHNGLTRNRYTSWHTKV